MKLRSKILYLVIDTERKHKKEYNRKGAILQAQTSDKLAKDFPEAFRPTYAIIRQRLKHSGVSRGGYVITRETAIETKKYKGGIAYIEERRKAKRRFEKEQKFRVATTYNIEE